jgi:hypothetical protein
MPSCRCQRRLSGGEAGGEKAGHGAGYVDQGTRLERRCFWRRSGYELDQAVLIQVADQGQPRLPPTGLDPPECGLPIQQL